jgi:crossover junction endodeoxyribonuclease RuvC
VRVLGIDPGLNTTGYAVVAMQGQRLELVEAGIIRGTDRGEMGSRLREIHEGVAEVVATFQPAALAIEELYSHYERPQTAILMGHARGVICLAAAQAGLPIRSYAATQIKRLLTGNGRAPKAQVQQAILREFGLREMPEPPDVADAMAIALCHHYLQHNWVESL